MTGTYARRGVDSAPPPQSPSDGYTYALMLLALAATKRGPAPGSAPDVAPCGCNRRNAFDRAPATTGPPAHPPTRPPSRWKELTGEYLKSMVYGGTRAPTTPLTAGLARLVKASLSHRTARQQPRPSTSPSCVQLLMSGAMSLCHSPTLASPRHSPPHPPSTHPPTHLPTYPPPTTTATAAATARHGRYHHDVRDCVRRLRCEHGAAYSHLHGRGESGGGCVQHGDGRLSVREGRAGAWRAWCAWCVVCVVCGVVCGVVWCGARRRRQSR